MAEGEDALNGLLADALRQTSRQLHAHFSTIPELDVFHFRERMQLVTEANHLRIRVEFGDWNHIEPFQDELLHDFFSDALNDVVLGEEGVQRLLEHMEEDYPTLMPGASYASWQIGDEDENSAVLFQGNRAELFSALNGKTRELGDRLADYMVNSMLSHISRRNAPAMGDSVIETGWRQRENEKHNTNDRKL